MMSNFLSLGATYVGWSSLQNVKFVYLWQTQDTNPEDLAAIIIS